MCAERSECLRPVPLIETERTVMVLLLAEEYSGISNRADLQREIAGSRGNPMAVIDALNALYGVGLVHFSGELVTPTRAAEKMWELSDGAI